MGKAKVGATAGSESEGAACGRGVLASEVSWSPPLGEVGALRVARYMTMDMAARTATAAKAALMALVLTVSSRALRDRDGGGAPDDDIGGTSRFDRLAEELAGAGRSVDEDGDVGTWRPEGEGALTIQGAASPLPFGP
jgi:hypothetical protein